MLTSLQHAKARGAKLVSVNPLPETGNFRFKNPQDFANPLKAVGTLVGTGTQLSDLWLPIKINGDLAFFKGLMKELLAEERKAPGKVIDLEFINQYTSGYEELIESLERAEWNEIVENSGLSRQQIRQAAEIAMNAKSIICCWAMGLTQHKNAVATIREVANFLLLRGNIGKKAPALVQSAVIAMCKATGPWAFGKDHLPPFSTSLVPGTNSIPLANTESQLRGGLLPGRKCARAGRILCRKE